MKDKFVRFLGLPWLYAGVALLAVSYILSLTHYTFLLFLGLLLILFGAAGWIIKEKHKSRY